MSPQARFIYILKPIGLDGPYKIGCSYEPASRLDAYLHWSPIPLEIVATFPGTLTLESNIHDCLAASHSHKEWFHGTDKVRAFAAAMAAGECVEEALNLTRREGRVRSKGWPSPTPARRLFMSLHMRCRGARARGERTSGRPLYVPLDAVMELAVLRRGDADPSDIGIAAIERFIADPIRHSGDRWISETEVAAILRAKDSPASTPEPCA